MNRLSWDSTAPRRPNGKRRGPQPRPELSELDTIDAAAELYRIAWSRPERLGPF